LVMHPPAFSSSLSMSMRASASVLMPLPPRQAALHLFSARKRY
jgi:hypothetical protein